MSDNTLNQLLDVIGSFAAPIAPSVIGATIASLIKRGLTWTERALQIFVGACASWYTLAAIAALWPLDPRLEQAIAFTAGLISAEALPRIREKLVARAVDLADAIPDWLISILRGKGGQ